jgi:hypothetical protein
MARNVVYRGWLFGINPNNPSSVRFAWPFTRGEKFDYLTPDAGAITDLWVDGEPDNQTLVIECGLTAFDLIGDSPATFQLSRRYRTG